MSGTNNSYANKTFQSGEELRSQISKQREKDLHTFILAEGNRYRFEINGYTGRVLQHSDLVGAKRLAFPNLRLLDENKKEILRGKNLEKYYRQTRWTAQDYSFDSIEFTAPGSGTYFLEVTGGIFEYRHENRSAGREEWKISYGTGEYTIKAEKLSNDAPLLTSNQAALTNATEGSTYTLKAADLLTGFSDPDGDKLSVTNLKPSSGQLTNNNKGTWSYTPEANVNGKVDLTYTVSDGNGGQLQGTNSFVIDAVNDAPTGTTQLNGDFKLGNTVTIDTSSIKDVDNHSGFKPDYKYSWEISDNKGSTWTKLTSADATDSNNSFKLTANEADKQVRGVVSYVDGYGTTEVLTSSAQNIKSGSIYSITSQTQGIEGEDITFTITRSGNTNRDGSVRFRTEDDIANTDDYQSADQIVKFAAGETSKQINIKTYNDNLNEGVETVTGMISAITIGDSAHQETAIARIIDGTLYLWEHNSSRKIPTSVDAISKIKESDLAINIKRTDNLANTTTIAGLFLGGQQRDALNLKNGDISIYASLDNPSFKHARNAASRGNMMIAQGLAFSSISINRSNKPNNIKIRASNSNPWHVTTYGIANSKIASEYSSTNIVLTAEALSESTPTKNKYGQWNYRTHAAGTYWSDIKLSKDNDSIAIKGNSTMSFSSVESTNIDTGGGDDLVNLIAPQSALESTALLYSNIKLGQGDDIIKFSGKWYSEMHRSNVDGGDGFDTIIADSLSIHDVRLARDDTTIHWQSEHNVISGIEKFVFSDGALFIGNTNDFYISNSRNNYIEGGYGSDSLYGNIGNDKIDGGADDDYLYGGEGKDQLIGGTGDDGLWGGAGADNLTGNTGDDFLNGDAGDDVIIGGSGSDTMSGGSGADRFVYKAVSESSATGDQDLIFDFNGSEGDRIDLSAIQGLRFIGSAVFSSDAGEVRFANGLLQADTSGDQQADFAVTLAGVSSFEKDFLII